MYIMQILQITSYQIFIEVCWQYRAPRRTICRRSSEIANFQDGDTLGVIQESRDEICNATFNAEKIKPAKIYRRISIRISSVTLSYLWSLKCALSRRHFSPREEVQISRWRCMNSFNTITNYLPSKNLGIRAALVEVY